MSDLHTMNDVVNGLRKVIDQREATIKELEAVVEQRNAESQIASEEINRMLSDFLESVRATLNASRNWSQ